jgi:hypothetical protein
MENQPGKEIKVEQSVSPLEHKVDDVKVEEEPDNVKAEQSIPPEQKSDNIETKLRSFLDRIAAVKGLNGKPLLDDFKTMLGPFSDAFVLNSGMSLDVLDSFVSDLDEVTVKVFGQEAPTSSPPVTPDSKASDGSTKPQGLFKSQFFKDILSSKGLSSHSSKADKPSPAPTSPEQKSDAKTEQVEQSVPSEQKSSEELRTKLLASLDKLAAKVGHGELLDDFKTPFEDFTLSDKINLAANVAAKLFDCKDKTSTVPGLPVLSDLNDDFFSSIKEAANNGFRDIGPILNKLASMMTPDMVKHMNQEERYQMVKWISMIPKESPTPMKVQMALFVHERVDYIPEFEELALRLLRAVSHQDLTCCENLLLLLLKEAKANAGEINVLMPVYLDLCIIDSHTPPSGLLGMMLLDLPSFGIKLGDQAKERLGRYLALVQ